MLNAALEMLGEAEVGALSLAQVARSLGVSTGAPYHHFKSREELIATIAAEGFELLLRGLDAVERNGPDPEQAVRAYAHTYIRFGVDRWTYYKVMFDPIVTRPETIELVRGTAEQCFAVVERLAFAFHPSGFEEGRVSRAVATWSLVHGVVTLFRNGPLPLKLSEAAAIEAAAQSALKILKG